jgi:hypothetical protein
MHYSAATASLSIGGALFVLPHLILGTGALIAGLSGHTFLRGLSGVSGRIVHVLIGAIFAGAALYSLLNGIYATHICRNAVREGAFTTIKGTVELTRRFAKSGYAYAEFKIGESSFRTNEVGLTCDCGFLTPIGKLVSIKSGMLAEAKIANGHIVELDIQSTPTPENIGTEHETLLQSTSRSAMPN